MLWLQRHSMATLYGTYAITIILMIFCIITFYYYAIIDINHPEGSNSHPFYVTEYSLMFCIFFGTANAMVIFRMFSLNMITLIMHALIHLIVVICIIVHLVLFNSMKPVKSFYHSYWIQVYIMLAVYSLQCLIALHLIIFKPGKTQLEREKRSGLHAFFGVVTFVVMFWNMMLMLSMLCINPKHTRSGDEKLGYGELLTEPSFLIIFLAIYMLLILFILLTPFFRADARDACTTEEERMVERDYAELSEQFLQARYLYEKEDEVERLGLVKPRQNLMVLTVSQTSIGGHRHRTPQNSRVDQMKFRLEEVWQDDRMVSQTSLEESHSPTPKKCQPLKRVAKIRRRRPTSSQCPINKESEPKCGCSKPCQSPSRCRSRVSRGPTASPPKLVRRSCSQIDLAATSCRRSSPKCSSAPCSNHEEDGWHHLKCEKPSLTSCEERNLYAGSPLRDNSRGSRLKTLLTSPMDVDPDYWCSCSKAICSDDNDIPFGICSTTSQINLAIERSQCSKTSSRTKMEDLSGYSIGQMTPLMKPIKKCMSCGKCSTTLQADKADGKPKGSKVTKAPPKKSMQKLSPMGKFPTTPQMEREYIRRGRYFSPTVRRNVPQKTCSDGDIHLASAPPIEDETEKPSIPSQKDFATDKKSVASQTELDREDYAYSRLPAAPSSSFKYTNKPIISERVPTTPRDQRYLDSLPDRSVPLQKRRLSAPESLASLADKARQSDKITANIAKEKDSTKHVTKSTNTQPTQQATTSSQTDFTRNNDPIERVSLEKGSSRDQWKPVPGLHGIHEIRTPQRRSSSLRSSTELARTSLRKEVIEKPLPEEKVKDVETKRRSSLKATNESIQNVSAVKTTPHSSPKELSTEPAIKDMEFTKEERTSLTATPLDDSSSKSPIKQGVSSSGLTGLAIQNEPIQELSKADNSLPHTSIVDSNLPRSISADRNIQRTSIVDFNVRNSSSKPDVPQASQSSLSRHSHGSSSPSGSSDSMIDTQKNIPSKSR